MCTYMSRCNSYIRVELRLGSFIRVSEATLGHVSFVRVNLYLGSFIREFIRASEATIG